LKKDVLDFAASIKTGCVNNAPLNMAELPPTFGLHMDCNEFLQVLNHIVKKAAQLTLAVFP